MFSSQAGLQSLINRVELPARCAVCHSTPGFHANYCPRQFDAVDTQLTTLRIGGAL